MESRLILNIILVCLFSKLNFSFSSQFKKKIVKIERQDPSAGIYFLFRPECWSSFLPSPPKWDSISREKTTFLRLNSFWTLNFLVCVNCCGKRFLKSHLPDHLTATVVNVTAGLTSTESDVTSNRSWNFQSSADRKQSKTRRQFQTRPMSSTTIIMTI